VHSWDAFGGASDSSGRAGENFENPFVSRAHLMRQMQRLILLLLVLLVLALGGLEVVASHRAPSSVPLPTAPSMLNEAE
jgi:hypothetical protein